MACLSRPTSCGKLLSLKSTPKSGIPASIRNVSKAAMSQRVAPLRRRVSQRHIFADHVTIEVRDERRRLPRYCNENQLVFTARNAPVTDHFPFDVGDKRLAALAGHEPLDVVRAETM